MKISVFVSLLSLVLLPPCPAQGEGDEALPILIDRYLDARYSPATEPTARLVERLSHNKVDAVQLEALLRKGRAQYPEPEIEKGKLHRGIPLTCEHVDYDTVYHLYLPKSYDGKTLHPLILVGHGGNGSMSKERADETAMQYIRFWIPAAEALGFIVAAPVTTRGWGSYGNSVLFSLISKLSREFAIDPDRIYPSGQSMGGHMCWRSGISFADRFGAVGPMSGGYDYVENEAVHNLFNVPGYAVHGSNEPYGIADYNRKIKAWMEERNYPWQIVEKNGGHTIYRDEVKKQMEFFAKTPRNLYRDRVFIRLAGSLRVDQKEPLRPGWDRDHTWNVERPLLRETVHWVRAFPDEDPKLIQRAMVTLKPDNRIEIEAMNTKKLRLYLHPKMVDFEKPVIVVVNGKERAGVKPKTDLALLLELVREFDDRGRIFYAAIDVEIPDSHPVPEPTFKDR